MTPGSPTPLEIGLLGIRKAMDGIARQGLPQMNIGLGAVAPMAGVSGGGGGSAQERSGSNITVNISNPKGETAETSIRRQLKNLSYLGVAQ